MPKSCALDPDKVRLLSVDGQRRSLTLLDRPNRYKETDENALPEREEQDALDTEELG